MSSPAHTACAPQCINIAGTHAHAASHPCKGHAHAHALTPPPKGNTPTRCTTTKHAASSAHAVWLIPPQLCKRAACELRRHQHTHTHTHTHTSCQHMLCEWLPQPRRLDSLQALGSLYLHAATYTCVCMYAGVCACAWVRPSDQLSQPAIAVSTAPISSDSESSGCGPRTHEARDNTRGAQTKCMSNQSNSQPVIQRGSVRSMRSRQKHKSQQQQQSSSDTTHPD